MNKRSKTAQFFLNLYLSVSLLLFIVPFLVIIATSLSGESAVMRYGYAPFIRDFTTDAYKYVFANPDSIISAYGVTALYAFVGTLFDNVIMAICGYAISRDKFTWKQIIIIPLIITMIFHGGLAPTYLIYTKVFGLKDNILVYFVAGMVSAYTIFIYRAFFKQVPISLSESAELDGASEMQIFAKIMLPLSLPTFATYSFMGLMSRWNSFETTLYYISDKRYYTLQYLLQLILQEANFIKQSMQMNPSSVQAAEIPLETVKFAMCVVAAGPMIAIFPFFQRYFSKGVMVGAVKG